MNVIKGAGKIGAFVPTGALGRRPGSAIGANRTTAYKTTDF